MSRGYIGASLGVGKSEPDLNWYKRFWGKFVWKYGGIVLCVLSVFATLLVAILSIGVGTTHLGKEYISYSNYVISIFFVLMGSVLLLLHLFYGLKWRDRLPEYKFEQLMRNAKGLSMRKLFENNPELLERLVHLINSAKPEKMDEMEQWMKYSAKYLLQYKKIIRIKTEYAKIDSEEELLRQMKEVLKI